MKKEEFIGTDLWLFPKKKLDGCTYFSAELKNAKKRKKTVKQWNEVYGVDTKMDWVRLLINYNICNNGDIRIRCPDRNLQLLRVTETNKGYPSKLHLKIQTW